MNIKFLDFKIILTCVLIISIGIGGTIYKYAQGPLEAEIAIKQLEDSVGSYTWSRVFSSEDNLLLFFRVFMGFLILLVWSRDILTLIFKKGRSALKIKSKNIIIVLLMVFMVGCMKPPKIEKIVEIEPHETAFLVPLEGRSKEGQAKFMSIEYLESPEVKVATKSISLPQRAKKIGRFGYEIEWIPTVRIIKVNRTPVTREWTSEKESGTSTKNEAIYVESKDSIGFSVGVNLTALVTEDDAAKFLYYYSGKPLNQIIDENIRGFVSSKLSQEFGSRELDECKSDKKEIQEFLQESVVTEFKNYGITVPNIGLVGGLTYEDKEIQKSMNDAYVAEMNIKTREMDKQAQIHENERKLSIAVTERRAAEEFDKAYDSMVKKIELDIEMKKAEALLKAAGKWSGNTPSSILPQGSNMLFGLDK